MPQTQRQNLRQAIREWILFEIGATDQLTKIKEEWMTKFSEYTTAVNETLAIILSKAVEEKAVLEKLLQATSDQNDAAIAEAKAELAKNKQSVVDAIAGIVTSAPSPVVPTPVPVAEVGTTKMPELVIPTIPAESVTIVNPDPSVPVTITPSPAGVGVDGGSNISAG